MPYFTSCVVIGVPSSKKTSSFRWYVHVFAPSLGVPRSVARSGAGLAPASPGSRFRVVSVRNSSEGMLPPPEVYSRAGSRWLMPPWFRTSSVPPWQLLGSKAAADEPGLPEDGELDDEHAAVPATRSARAAERTGIFRMGKPLRGGDEM